MISSVIARSTRILPFVVLTAGVGAIAVPAPTMARGGSSTVFGIVAGGSCGPKSSFSVSTASGTSRVRTTSRTLCIAHSPAAVVAGFQKGDNVVAQGTPAGALIANTVVYDTAPFAVPGTGRILHGTFASASDNQLSITQANGVKVTVDVGPNTTYLRNGAAVSAPDYAPGDKIAIHAVEYTDGHLRASLVVIWGKRS